MFFNLCPADVPNLLHVVKKHTVWLGVFSNPLNPQSHIQLSPSVNYAIQWQGQKERERERNRDENRRRAAAYVLCWYSMLRGRYASWDFFCLCSGFAEWPLWALTLSHLTAGRTRAHTHTRKFSLPHLTHKQFSEHPKSIHTTDSGRKRHMRSLLCAKCSVTCVNIFFY